MSVKNYTSVAKFVQQPVYGVSDSTLIDTTQEAPTGPYSFIGGSNNFPANDLKMFMTNSSHLTTNFYQLYEEKKQEIINKLNYDLEHNMQQYKVNSLPSLVNNLGVIDGKFIQFINTYSANLVTEISDNTFQSGDEVYLTIKMQFLNIDNITYTSPYTLSLKFIIY